MHLYLPRRHRRQLLLPPGLLALAGLLWLGCGLLQTHSEQLKLRTVMQLTMPPRPTSDFLWESSLGYPEPRLRYSQLPYFRHWRTVEFGRGRGLDSLAARELVATVQDLASGWESAPGHDGLRVRFGPQARYASLVLVLDLMAKYNVKKYFFDLHHPRTRTTFYAFSGDARRQRWADPVLLPTARPAQVAAVVPPPAPSWQPCWDCMASVDNWYPNTMPLADVWWWLTSPEWQLPLAVLACLGTLGLWRARPRR